MNYKKSLLIIGATASMLGLLGVVPGAYYWYRDRQGFRIPEAAQASSVTAPTVVDGPQVVTGYPTRLHIPSLGLDLPVMDGVYSSESGQWTLSNNSVHYALMTVQPNDTQGNTLIYGHYRPGVFAALHTLQPGAIVSVVTDNGYEFTYKFIDSQVVAPDDTEILGYGGEPQLTLQTCTGVFMQNRQLFHFELIDVVTVKKI